MILMEEHVIRCGRRKELYRKIDGYCFTSKNLHNETNYLISQCSRISRKIAMGEIIDSWEKGLIYRVNCGLWEYNSIRKKKAETQGKKPPAVLPSIDGDNGFVADPFFLCWYMKKSENYRAMPYATAAQICIREVCRNWKSFYKGMKRWKKDPDGMTGRPSKPGYLDKTEGRNAISLTYQNFSLDGEGNVSFPGFLSEIRIRAGHRKIKQVSILTDGRDIRFRFMYETEGKPAGEGDRCMGIDPGINNLLALSFEGGADPVLINGKPLKSINRYYNKKKAELQEKAKKSNSRDCTNRIRRLTRKRNRKVRDYMHKASRKVIRLAEENGVGLIVIGNNRGWKQEVNMGKKTNQSFTNIPHKKLIDMICYKAGLAGIKAVIVNESYTSGTSYLDGENPEKKNYDRSRRIRRGLFRSTEGKLINADVNAAYQIMKKGKQGIKLLPEVRKVRKVNVS